MRSFLAVRRADVAVIVCDAAEGLTEQDVKIAGYVNDQGKPSVVVMNKWDLVEKDTYTVEKFEKKLREDLKFMDYFKSVYISAVTGKRAENILPLCRKVLANSRRRITTGLLNEVLQDAIRISEPPSRLGRKLKILYITEASVSPPDIRHQGQRPGTHAFQLQALSRKRPAPQFRFRGHADKAHSARRQRGIIPACGFAQYVIG